MAVTVTMLQTRRGEDGNLWTAGSAQSATDAFAQFLISSNLATGTLPAVPQSGLSPADSIAVKSLVSGAAKRRPLGAHPLCIPYSRCNASFTVDAGTGTTFNDVFELQAAAFRWRPIYANGSTSVTYDIAAFKMSCPQSAADLNNNAGAWATGSFTGGSTVPVAPGASRRGYKFGDWADVSNVGRSKFVAVRSSIAAGAGAITIMGSSGVSLTNWATRTDGRLRMCRNQTGQHVSVLAGFTTTTDASVSPCIGVQYQTAAGVVTVMKGGDSIDEGQGTYKGESFWDYAIRAAGAAGGFPVEIANLAWAASDYNQFPYAFEEAIAAGLIPHATCFPIGTPNGFSGGSLPTANGISTLNARTARMIQASQSVGAAVLLRTWLPSNHSLTAPSGGTEDYGTADSLRRDYNAAMLAEGNVSIFDAAGVLEAGVDAQGQGYMLAADTTDGIHPNDAGNARLAVQAVTPVTAVLAAG